MELCNVLAGVASGILVGYLDLLMLMHTARHALHGSAGKVNLCMKYGLLVRLPIVGVLFYVFLAVLRVGVAGFLSGLAMSTIMASLHVLNNHQKLMEEHMSAIPESIAYNFGALPTSMVMSWFVWLLIIVPSCAVRLAFKRIPGKLQTLFEICFEWIFNLADEFIGEEAPRYYPLFCGLFIYVLVSNLIGLIPGCVSPTADLSVTASLAVLVFVYYNVLGLRKYGFKYISHFFGPPMPWYLSPVRGLLFVIEIIGNFAKPFSLAMRLFCNILSKEILLALLAYLIVYFISGHDITQKALLIAPLVLRPFIVMLGFMLAFVQALIFMVLTITYIAGAVRHEEHESTGGKELC